MDTHNRSFEFRAWHIENQQLFNVFGFSDNLIIEQDTFLTWPRNECILMQFTGMLDRNGTKIWERDILLNECVCEDEDGKDRLMKWYDEVVYMKGTFVIIDRQGRHSAIIDVTQFHPADKAIETVVGNSLQHSHLFNLSDDLEGICCKQDQIEVVDHATVNTEISL